MTWPSSKSTFDFRPFIPCSKLPRHTPLKYGIVWKYTTPAFTGLSSFSPFESPTSFWDTPTNHHASIRLLVNIPCIYICICLYELFPSQSHIVLGSPTLTTPNNARSANLRREPFMGPVGPMNQWDDLSVYRQTHIMPWLGLPHIPTSNHTHYMSNLENPRFTERTSTNLGRSHRLPHVCTIMIYGKLGGYRLQETATFF